MTEELLAEIVAVEREIRRELFALEEEMAARLATVRGEVEEELRQEVARLEAELAGALEHVTRSALSEAQAVVAEASSFARRIRSIEPGQLDGIIVRHLHYLRREEKHDRPDEQA